MVLKITIKLTILGRAGTAESARVGGSGFPRQEGIYRRGGFLLGKKYLRLTRVARRRYDGSSKRRISEIPGGGAEFRGRRGHTNAKSFPWLDAARSGGAGFRAASICSGGSRGAAAESGSARRGEADATPPGRKTRPLRHLVSELLTLRTRRFMTTNPTARRRQSLRPPTSVPT